MPSEVLQSLRLATHASHVRLDAALDMPAQLSNPEGRRALTIRFHGWQAGAERALGERLAGLAGLDFQARRRAHRFSQDLAALGVTDIDALPVCAVPYAANDAEALGLLYVLEGSTLGGKVIGKMLSARGQDLVGLGFLDPYGPRTGEMWRGFLAVLEREGDLTPAASAGIVRGGVAGFQAAEDWLCGAGVGA